VVEAQKKRPMNPSKILELVKQGADVRWGDTIERLLLVLRQHHTHQSWRKECDCEYCRFINGKYTYAKLTLHKMKKERNILEAMYWDATDGDVAKMYYHYNEIIEQKWLIRQLKDHKKDLQQNII